MRSRILEDQRYPDKTLPGAEFARFRLPFLATPCPIFFDMVLIFSCPLWTRFLNICCTFFPVEPSIEERLRSGDKGNLRSGSAGVGGVTVIGGSRAWSVDWPGRGSIEPEMSVVTSSTISWTSDTMTTEPGCVTAERPVSTEDLTEIVLVNKTGNVQGDVHVR